jgi:mannose-6-phosphate isomerase
VQHDYRTEYVPTKNQGVSLVHCNYFHTAVYDLNEPMLLDYSELDSFVILVLLKGEGKVIDNEGNEIILRAGNTLLIPASTKTLQITGTIQFLETYV